MTDSYSEIKPEKRSKKKFIIIFSAMLLIFLLPIVLIATVTFALTPVYNDSFVGELGEKYRLLSETEEPKIVVIGGSSVAFGLDSPMVEKHLGMPTVNFGLYANLGTKLMLDLSRSGIGSGDIVVIAPEINDQTLSLYFNQETAMQALDGNFDMLSEIDSDNYEALIGASFKFSSDKLGYLISGERPENQGAYRKEHFNKNGDNVFDRPYNTMSAISKTIDFNFIYDETDGVSTDYEKFIDYLNEYVAFCTDKGATVYFSFCPMNSASISDSVTEDSIVAFYDNLVSNLHCKVISNIGEYILDEGYFFDSEFHLNNSGVTVRTVRLIDDIKREIGITDITMSKEDLPLPSGYQTIEFESEDEENLYFVLELTKNGAGQEVYRVVGLNELGLSQVGLRIPSSVGGIPVDAIMGGALEGAQLRTLVLSKNVRTIASLAFSGAKNLVAVRIPHDDPNLISIPNNANAEGLATDGANPEIRLLVPESALESYKADYFWGDYSGKLSSYSE